MSLPVLLLSVNKSHFKKLKNDQCCISAEERFKKSPSYCHKGGLRLSLPAMDTKIMSWGREARKSNFFVELKMLEVKYFFFFTLQLFLN